MMSEYDKANVDKIIFNGEGDWFTAQLLRLMTKADNQNLERFRRGFPEEVEAFERWRSGVPANVE